ncbi:MAG: 5-(carboxyamino)imidazole ribonucleotide synthase, partial [Actinomycetia bacterium]|nr:5-(carboxyamino)imidazole ribonucleotide synthase [Actinomycetes bacterium]
AHEVSVGDYRSLDDLRSFAAGCDVLTFDHEHVPNEHLRALVAAGVNVQPSPDALRYAQDKLAMRRRLSAEGLPCPRWAPIRSADDLAAFADLVGWPLVVKTARGGYDGKGVWVLSSPAEAGPLLASGMPLLAEERVPIVRELAAVVARSPLGQGAAWPIVQTVQADGICVEVIAPAPGLSVPRAAAAQRLALRIADQLGITGVLAVELFETAAPDRGGPPPVPGDAPARVPGSGLATDRLLINELAMRPHNSGHWTIEGSRTSQFEQHVRAVLDYPLGATGMTAPAVVMANVLGGPVDVMPSSLDERVHHCLARWPDVKIHLYGKGFRPGRKVGHVTALGDELAATRARARAAADYLSRGDGRGQTAGRDNS